MLNNIGGVISDELEITCKTDYEQELDDPVSADGADSAGCGIFGMIAGTSILYVLPFLLLIIRRTR
jgi:hypothetical protein